MDAIIDENKKSWLQRFILWREKKIREKVRHAKGTLQRRCPFSLISILLLILFNDHIHHKGIFCIGKLCDPPVPFGNRCNGRKSDAGTVLAGGEIHSVFLFYPPVKTVGGHDIKARFVFHTDCQLMVTVLGRYTLASLPYIFQNIPQKGTKFHIRN